MGITRECRLGVAYVFFILWGKKKKGKVLFVSGKMIAGRVEG